MICLAHEVTFFGNLKRGGEFFARTVFKLKPFILTIKSRELLGHWFANLYLEFILKITYSVSLGQSWEQKSIRSPVAEA